MLSSSAIKHKTQTVVDIERYLDDGGKVCHIFQINSGKIGVSASMDSALSRPDLIAEFLLHVWVSSQLQKNPT